MRRFLDWFDAHRAMSVALCSVLLLCALGVGSLRSAPVALADAACGDAPDWWTFGYASWLACEAQNGGAAVTVQAITSPMLDTINSSLAPLSSLGADIVSGINNGPLGSLSSAIGGVGASVTNGITGVLTALFVPTSADIQPLTDAWVTQMSLPPFSTITSMQAGVAQLGSSLGSYSSSSASSPTVTVSTPSGSDVTVDGNFGVLAGGVAMLNGAFASWGVTQQVMYGIGDCVWFLILLSSILSDLGGRMGEIGAITSQGWSVFTSNPLPKSERLVNEAWAKFNTQRSRIAAHERAARAWERYRSSLGKD